MLAVDDFLHQIQGQVVVVIGGLEADARVVSRQFEQALGIADFVRSSRIVRYAEGRR